MRGESAEPIRHRWVLRELLDTSSDLDDGDVQGTRNRYDSRPRWVRATALDS